jgi:hypothetical protein
MTHWSSSASSSSSSLSCFPIFDDCCNVMSLKICSNQNFPNTGCKKIQCFFFFLWVSILWLVVAEVVIIHKIDDLARFGYILDVWHHNPKAQRTKGFCFFCFPLYLKAPPSTEEDSFTSWRTDTPFNWSHGGLPPFELKNLFVCFTLRKACWDLKGLPGFAGLDPWATALAAIC